MSFRYGRRSQSQLDTCDPRLRTLFEMIEPFELARTPDYDREMFDFYRELHGGDLERPVRSP